MAPLALLLAVVDDADTRLDLAIARRVAPDRPPQPRVSGQTDGLTQPRTRTGQSFGRLRSRGRMERR
jgi:hypothetical protein